MPAVRTPRWKSPSTSPKPDGAGWRVELRRSTEPDAESVQLSTSDGCRLRVARGEQILIDGDWIAAITVGGKKMQPTAPWEDVCFHSDKDVDYQELELPLTGGRRLQRQIVLARDDRFLFLQDCVLSPEGGQESARIDYHGSLPLSPGVEWLPAGETHEGRLTSKYRPIATVLPVAFPEWRTEKFPGELSFADRSLHLKQLADGRNLCCPLFIDLDPQRFRQPLTWRRLTVAEALDQQPKDVAVGYRVQVGAAQWVFYRALSGRGNRTAMGYNTAYEFACVRFLSEGKLEPILEIE